MSSTTRRWRDKHLSVEVKAMVVPTSILRGEQFYQVEVGEKMIGWLYHSPASRIWTWQRFRARNSLLESEDKTFGTSKSQKQAVQSLIEASL